jgi:hypothetical protein
VGKLALGTAGGDAMLLDAAAQGRNDCLIGQGFIDSHKSSLMTTYSTFRAFIRNILRIIFPDLSAVIRNL